MLPLSFSGFAQDLWSEQLLNTDDQSKYISAFKSNVDFAVDLGIKGVRVDCVQPPTIHTEADFDILFNRLTKTWDTCINYAADKGIYVTWEFEPGFAFNKPSLVLKVLDKLQYDNFGLMYDTCHGQMLGVIGIRQEGEKDIVGNQLELIKKFSGHSDQLSRVLGGIEQYRIRSLEKILASKSLSGSQFEAAKDMLIHKLQIYAKGLKKREKNTEFHSVEKKIHGWLNMSKLN